MKKYLMFFVLMLNALSMSAYAYNCCPGNYCQSSDCSGPYVSAFGGANWLNQHKMHHVKSTYDVGYNGGAALGYRFNQNFRGEIEGAYRNNHLDKAKWDGESVRVKGHTDTWSVMANGYWDINMNSYVTPYVGLGVGYAHVKAHFKDDYVSAKGSNSGVAGQVIVGASTRICHNTDLGLEYRYFLAKSNFHEQSVNLSLRYAF